MSIQATNLPATTGLGHEITSKTISVEESQYQWGVSTTLRNRLKAYQKNLVVSRGINGPLFDDKLMDLVYKYARNSRTIRAEIDYLNTVVDDEGHKFSRNLKQYNKIESQLRGFMSDNHRNLFWNENYRLALKQVSESLRISGLKALRYRTDDDIVEVLPKANTHSGFTYLQTGMKNKGDNTVGLLRKLNKRLSECKELGRLSIPNLIAFRTQASGEYTDKGERTYRCKHKTRMVVMVDLVTIANELQFSVPFMRQFQYNQSYAGGKNDRDIRSIISGYRGRNKYHLTLDYSLYDQSVSDWLIRDAFQLIKDCFIMEADDEFKFNCVVNDFVHKEFVTDLGIVKSNKGIPSGSMFTQVIGSLINQIVVRTYLNSINVEGEMIVMGDDNLIFTNSQLDIGEISSYVKHNFGMTINPDKSRHGKQCDDPEFLSRIWTSLGPTRAWQQVISRMAFPERFRTYNEEVQPQLVLYAYYLTYMSVGEIINVEKLISDFRLNKREVQRVDSRYIPGVLAYLREYESR